MDDSRTGPGRRPTPAEAAEIRAGLAGLGEYFTLSSEFGAKGRHITGLFEPATLSGFVDRMRAAMAVSMRCAAQDIPLRVAASSFHSGVAARLLSPAIGAAVTAGVVPELSAESVVWQNTDHHFPQFGCTGGEWLQARTAAEAARAIVFSVVREVLDPLSIALRATVALSPTVMSGNVVSAANGAVTVLAMSRPHEEARGRALIRALVETEQLGGTAGFEHGRFVRRSCCLFYLAPVGGLCGDCVLTVS
jgi:ferric iron reductase protein FhuF